MIITSFVLGMLTVVGMAVAILVVLGIVKIYKQSNQITALEAALEKEVDRLQRNIFDGERAINDNVSRVEMENHRIFNVLEDTMCRNFDDVKREYMSYVDSRIDKLQAKKEILNG